MAETKDEEEPLPSSPLLPVETKRDRSIRVGLANSAVPSPAALQSPLSIKIPENNGTGATWELTWPIWHLLPHGERQRIASEYGMRIGEFEEFVSLQEAMGDSLPPSESLTYSGQVSTRDNTSGRPPNTDDEQFRSQTDTAKGTFLQSSSSWVTDTEDLDEEEDNNNNKEGPTSEAKSFSSKNESVQPPVDKDDINVAELIKEGGLMMLLPDEVIHRIMSNLDVHMFAQCALVCPRWRSFTQSEASYKILCERIYHHQSRRKQLNLSRFKTFHNMLATRPRVRTGGGLYVLKYSQVKKIQRDMWTEIPVGAVLETTYYRYLLFDENSGTVLYSLTPKGPLEMIPKFKKFERELIGRRKTFDREEEALSSDDKRILLGEYQVHRDRVRVRAKYAWSYLQMELKIITKREEAFQPSSKFGELALLRHETSISGSFQGHDIVEYDAPNEHFLFLSDRRL